MAILAPMAQTTPVSERLCPPEIQKRIERKLFGRTPTEAWAETRHLASTTRVVYASVCSLINGPTARLKTSEVAYLANLGERQTRRHLQVLTGEGFLVRIRPLGGPYLYTLGHDCAARREWGPGLARPSKPGHPGMPIVKALEKDLEIPPFTPVSAAGDPSVNAESANATGMGERGGGLRSCFPASEAGYHERPSEASGAHPVPKGRVGEGTIVREHLEGSFGRQESDEEIIGARTLALARAELEVTGGGSLIGIDLHQKVRLAQAAEQRLERVKAEVTKEVLRDRRVEAAREEVKRAKERGKVPEEWIETLERVRQAEPAVAGLLEQAAVREHSPAGVVLAVEGGFLATQLRARPLKRILGMPIRIERGLRSGEESLFSSLAAAYAGPVPVPDTEEVERRAAQRLGLGALPKPSAADLISRYGREAARVVAAAAEISRGEPARERCLLAEWTKADPKRVITMVREFQARQAGSDRVKAPVPWCRWYLRRQTS